jgi:hypothetical protein
METLARTVKSLTDNNQSVRAQKGDKGTDAPDSVKYRRRVTLMNGRLEDVETAD